MQTNWSRYSTYFNDGSWIHLWVAFQYYQQFSLLLCKQDPPMCKPIHQRHSSYLLNQKAEIAYKTPTVYRVDYQREAAASLITYRDFHACHNSQHNSCPDISHAKHCSLHIYWARSGDAQGTMSGHRVSLDWDKSSSCLGYSDYNFHHIYVGKVQSANEGAVGKVHLEG